MNFIQSLFRDMKKIFNGTYKPKLERQNYCIGSGGNFEIYKKMTREEAFEVFNNLDVRQCFGSKISEKIGYYYALQEYHTMESNTGSTFIFMFPVKCKFNSRRKK